jgi:hypothetical protein
MDEVQTRARLVDSAVSGFAASALSTTVPRAEIEEAMASGDYPARLMLDISRVEGGRTSVIPYARVAVEWDEPTLEELLRATSADEVTLRFDADALERALEESEVDAHGLRERAAVLVVTVAAVGVGAGGASALTGGAVAGVSAAPVTLVSDVQSGGTGEPVAAASFVSDVASGGSGEPVAGLASGDSWALSPAADAGIAAGVALLISAAGFTLVRSRKQPVRPA